MKHQWLNNNKKVSIVTSFSFELIYKQMKIDIIVRNNALQNK